MKVKKIAKRMRAAELHQLVRADETRNAFTERALLMADVLNEVADQISPRNTAKGHAMSVAVQTTVLERVLGWEKGKDSPPPKAAHWFCQDLTRRCGVFGAFGEKREVLRETAREVFSCGRPPAKDPAK